MNRRRDEHGFTLPELVLAVVILGTIIGVVAEGLSTSLRVTQDADRRIAESADVQLLASWLPGDVQSAVGGVTPAASTCTAAGDEVVLGLTWTDSGTAKRVAYVVVTQDGSRALVRRTCTGTAPPAWSHTLVRFLQPGPATNAVAVQCTPASCSATGTTPLRVTMVVTDADGRAQGVTATRRTNG